MSNSSLPGKRIRIVHDGDKEPEWEIFRDGGWYPITKVEARDALGEAEIAHDIEVPAGEKGNPNVRRK